MEAMESVDMAQLIFGASDLSAMINQSLEVETYLQAKSALDQDPEYRRLLPAFTKKKTEYEEVQRFGKYHPDFSRVSSEMRELKRTVEMLDTVQAFKRAENDLDELLYHVGRTIADAVSDTIKVPSNNPFLEAKASGCGTGGSCGCGTKKKK
ncbi:YlbF family regulator [Brevibacillus fluminis]|uniref:YlbF family regulator n=1 Tax=Brevibacillus fluminis TaxID=511487 RepID=A0A3M8CVF8_9BACL|nr:YlbF family regulator [Brevibacillus fluminis]RNB79237.1 YlbF family regulator [Brevibacillus fluminis]